MSFLRPRSLFPLFTAAAIVTSGWLTAHAGNDNPPAKETDTTGQPKPGRVVIADDRKEDAQYVELVPVFASKGRVAIMVYVPKELALFDKQLLLAVKAAAEEYATSTGRDVRMVLLPDNDGNADTVAIHVWAGGDPYQQYKITKRDKRADTPMIPSDYHDIRKVIGEMMREGWNKYQTNLQKEVKPGTPAVVASTTP